MPRGEHVEPLLALYKRLNEQQGLFQAEVILADGSTLVCDDLRPADHTLTLHWHEVGRGSVTLSSHAWLAFRWQKRDT